jgi:hypothetical protein
VNAVLTGGSSNVPCDWSVSIDSNVVDKVAAYLEGKNIGQADTARVEKLIELKLKKTIRFDTMPFLLENVRLVRNYPNNLRPAHTLAAFRLLDHIDDTCPKKTSPYLCYKKSLDELKIEARLDFEKFLDDVRYSNTFSQIELKAQFTFAFLLELAVLRLSPGTASAKFTDLINFCIFKLGKLPQRELRIAWEFFSNSSKHPFFGPIHVPAIELSKKIKGMAWDLTHWRSLEQFATHTKLGSFFIPFFASFDGRFLNLIDLSPTDYMVIDDTSKQVLFGQYYDTSFLKILDEHVSPLARPEFTTEKIEYRRRMPLNKDYLDKVIVELESIILNMTESLKSQ